MTPNEWLVILPMGWIDMSKLQKTILMSDDSLLNRPIGITNGRMSIRECTKREANSTVSKHHYSKKATKNSFMSFRVDMGGKAGYMQLGYGIRPAMKQKICTLIEKGNFAEFDRMWLPDAMPRFSESMAIGLLLSYLKQVYPEIKFLITYADESVGNTGVIYKATNAIQIGSAQCDFYILPDGERLHPVSMYHRHGTRAKAFVEKQYPGIKHIKGKYRQFRFLYILDRRIKKAAMRDMKRIGVI